MIATFTTAAHVAVIHVENGQGLLRRPAPDGDMFMSGPPLHHADLDRMRSVLMAHEWEVQIDDDELFEHVDMEPNGSELVALYGPSLRSEVSMMDLVESMSALREAIAAL